ncbi:uncharacterized protein [Drosophila tropicalis]|uniref:uncharacterized protein n=1 Tax=Drosophila tropicalis TaxID=46794 RepID=UPI0035AB8B9A
MYNQHQESNGVTEKNETLNPNRKQHWSWNLRVVISNLYMKTERRLPGACVPRCLQNAMQCVSMHRCAPLPDEPCFLSTQALRNTLHGQHYETFLELVEMKVLQGIYPGDGIMERLADMAMILTAKGISVAKLIILYKTLVRVFYLLLNTFPPCWTGLRPYYVNFLKIPVSGVTTRHSKPSPGKLQFCLDLVENIIPECREEEIGKLNKFYQKHEYNFSEEEKLDLSQESVFLRHVQSYNWMDNELCLDDFNQLDAPVRLSRVFDVLNMLTRVLEMELLSWLDHNRFHQSSVELFQDGNEPFAVLALNLKPNEFFTDSVRQVMRLFSLGAAKSLDWERLNILQRLISLIMEISNTAELKYVDNAIIYPNLGPFTQKLITDFFAVFKTHNAEKVQTYIEIIPQLDQPYLRFEFVDHFLKLFSYTRNQPFGPQKVYREFQSKQWVNYKPKTEIAADQDGEVQLSREDYLDILLVALKAYCQWLDLDKYCNYLKTKEIIQPLQTTIFVPFAESKEEPHTSPSSRKTKMITSRPKINVPVAKIHVHSMSERYGSSILYLRRLKRLLNNKVANLIDVTAWQVFLDDFFDHHNGSSPET